MILFSLLEGFSQFSTITLAIIHSVIAFNIQKHNHICSTLVIALLFLVPLQYITRACFDFE